MEAAAVLEGVEVRVPGAPSADGRILGPVDLRIERGQRWVLLGPNGSGKTTLLSVLGAWRQPSAGSATVLGSRLGAVDVRELRTRIGHVSHHVADRLRTTMQVEDVVLTGKRSALEPWFQRFDETDHGRARRLLDEAGCDHLAERALRTCSQGERQRVLLARARMGEPELLLLDEPAAGLDLPGREALLAAIATTGDDALTVVMATHHLEEIPPNATQAALLRNGRLVAAGGIDETLTSEPLAETFGVPIAVERVDGRWFGRVRSG